MNVTFFDHGKGNVKGALNYIVGDVDHEGNPRATKPIIHSGNTEILQSVCDGIGREYCYTSGVIREDGILNPDLKDHIMQSFEQHAFAGLDKNQYEIMWVEHNDHDATELHFVVAMTELNSNKQLNIAPPGHEQYFKPWRDEINIEHDLSRPDIAVNTVCHPQFENTNQREAREILNSFVEASYANGAVSSVSDIEELFENAGCKINRRGKNYISVITPEHDKPIRLKGGFYDKANWENNELAGTYELSGEEQLRRNNEHLKRSRQQRIERHQKRCERYARDYQESAPRSAEINEEIVFTDKIRVEANDGIDQRNEQKSTQNDGQYEVPDNESGIENGLDNVANNSAINSNDGTNNLGQDEPSISGHTDQRVDSKRNGLLDTYERNQTTIINEENNNGDDTTGTTLINQIRNWYEGATSTIAANFKRFSESLDRAKQAIEPAREDVGKHLNTLEQRAEQASKVIGSKQHAISELIKYFKGTGGTELINERRRDMELNRPSPKPSPFDEGPSFSM